MSGNANEGREPLKTRTAIGYGIGAVGEGIGYNVFFAFFSFFLTTVAGIEPAIAGVISGVAVLWDAITDPIIGNWSDRTKNPRGRRRPFIMTGSVLFGVSIALLYINIDIPYGWKIAYFIAVNALYWITLTTCVIPHISLGSEMTADFDERTKLRTWAVTLMGIGTLIAVGTPLLLVDFYSGVFGSESAGWAFAGVTYGVIVALVYNICCKIIKDKEPSNPNLLVPEKSSGTKKAFADFLKNAGKALHNKSLVHLLAVTFFVNVVVTLGSGLAIYLFTYVFGFDDGESSLVYTLQGILVILAALAAGYVAKKTEKKTVMVGGIIVYAMSYLVIIILPISWSTIVISIFLFALGNSGYWTMIYAMSYDTAIVEQIRSDDRPDGLYTSLIGLCMKFGNAAGALITGVGLQLTGFSSAAAVQSEATVSGIRTLYGVAPAIVLAVALLFACMYPITKKKYLELSAVYQEKQQSGTYDEQKLNGL